MSIQDELAVVADAINANSEQAEKAHGEVVAAIKDLEAKIAAGEPADFTAVYAALARQKEVTQALDDIVVDVDPDASVDNSLPGDPDASVDNSLPGDPDAEVDNSLPDVGEAEVDNSLPGDPDAAPDQSLPGDPDATPSQLPRWRR